MCLICIILFSFSPKTFYRIENRAVRNMHWNSNLILFSLDTGSLKWEHCVFIQSHQSHCSSYTQSRDVDEDDIKACSPTRLLCMQVSIVTYQNIMILRAWKPTSNPIWITVGFFNLHRGWLSQCCQILKMDKCEIFERALRPSVARELARGLRKHPPPPHRKFWKCRCHFLHSEALKHAFGPFI